MQEVPRNGNESNRPARLSPVDRRLLLVGQLELLIRRLRCGLPVRRDDIRRLIPYISGSALIERSGACR